MFYSIILSHASRSHRITAQKFTVAVLTALLFSFYSAHVFAKDQISIAVDVWLPYENINNTDAPGFSTEVVTNVLSTMGIKWDLKEYPWVRALKEVYNGNRDALFTAFWTEERARYCYYPTEPLAQEKWVFFVRRQERQQLSFTLYDEIKDRRIGVLRGASVTEDFWSFVKEHANYEEVGTDDLNFRKLLAGRIDYVVTSYSNGIELGKQMDITDQIDFLRSPVLTEDDLYVIFSKKSVSPTFVDAFSDALKTYKDSDEYGSIYHKYFGLP